MSKPFFLPKLRIVLGSQSPRRKQILEEAGLNLKLAPVNVEESFPAGLSPDEIVVFLAAKKNAAYNKLAKNEVFITSDTLVALDGEVLGKPKDLAEARLMLRKLSGSVHQVFTAVCLNAWNEHFKQILAKTEVEFKEISEEEIDYYFEVGAPLDKAGAYGIQEWIGQIAVEKIKGSYFNVVGLPIQKVVSELNELHEKII